MATAEQYKARDEAVKAYEKAQKERIAEKEKAKTVSTTLTSPSSSSGSSSNQSGYSSSGDKKIVSFIDSGMSVSQYKDYIESQGGKVTQISGATQPSGGSSSGSSGGSSSKSDALRKALISGGGTEISSVEASLIQSNAVSAVAQGTASPQQKALVERLGGVKTPGSVGASVGGVSDEQKIQSLLNMKRNEEVNKLNTTASLLQKQADVLERRSSDFNSRYVGRQLSQQEYNDALREKEALQYASMELNRRIREYEGNVKRDEQSKSISKSSLAQTMILDPRQAPKIILPGQKGYGELGIYEGSEKQRKKLEQEKKDLEALPSSFFYKENPSFTSGTMYYQLEKGKDIYVAPGIEGVKSYKDFIKEFSRQEDVARQAFVTPEDILLYTPGISGRFFGSSLKLIGLTGKGAFKLVAPNISSKLGNLVKPIIRFPKYSNVVEKRIGSAEKFTVTGEGILEYTETNKLREFFKLAPKLKSTPINYNFDVTQAYNLIGKAKNIKPLGSPFTLQGLIPEERFVDLLSQQKFALKNLSGRTGFVSEGIVKIGKPGAVSNIRITSEAVDVFTKSPRVRVAPVGFKDSQTTFFAKIRSVGEGLSGGKVRAISFSDELSAFTQKLRAEAGVKLDVKGIFGKGNAPSALGRIPSYETALKLSAKKSKSLIGVGGMGKESIISVEKTITQPALGVSKFTSVGLISKPVEKGIVKVSSKQTQRLIANVVDKSVKVGSTGVKLVVPSLVDKKFSFVEQGTKFKVDEGLKRSFQTPGVSRVDLKLKELSLQKFTEQQKVSIRQSTRTGTREGTNVGLKDSQMLGIKEATNITEKDAVALAQQQSLAQQFKQAQVLKQTQSLRQLVTPRMMVTPRVAVAPKFPLLPIIPLPDFKFGKVGFGPGSANVKKGFSVFSRVGGKEKVLAVNVPKGVALSIGKSFTGRTTARSFKIKEAGFTRQKDVALPGLFQYRSPKLGGRVSKEGFTFVEKSKYAIDTLSEASELKSARRAKKKKRK